MSIKNLFGPNDYDLNLPYYLECSSKYTEPPLPLGTYYLQAGPTNNSPVSTWTRAGKIKLFQGVPATTSYTFNMNNHFINGSFSQVLIWSAEQNQSSSNNVPLLVNLVSQTNGQITINIANNDVNNILSIPFIYFMII